MTAGHEQGHERWLRVFGFDRVGEQVGFHVVYSQDGYIEGGAKALGPIQPDEKSADESGPRSHADADQVFRLEAGFVEGGSHNVIDLTQVRPGCDLGYNPAEPGVSVLCQNDVSEDSPVLQDRR